MASDKDILKAMADLRSIGDNYKAPKLDFTMDDYGSKYKVDYSKAPQINWDGFAGNPNSEKDKKKKKKVDSKVNLWDVLTGTLGQPSGAITTQGYNMIDALKKLNDDVPLSKKVLGMASALNPATTIADGLIAGGKKQWKNWTDDKLSWGDVPGIGVLNGMDKSWKRGKEIMEDHTDVENKWGKIGGGIAIDVVADPLTYFTGGATLAIKAGKVAEARKVASLAKGIGVTKKVKTADELAEVAKDTLRTKYPNMSDNIINKRVEQLRKQAQRAKNEAYNLNINKYGASIPFNKANVALGNIGKKNPLYRTEATLGSHARIVDDLLKQASTKVEDVAKAKQMVKQLYKVDDISKLTKGQFDDLVKRLTPVINATGKGLPDAKTLWKPSYGAVPNIADNIDDVITKMDEVSKRKGKPLDQLVPPKVTSPRGVDKADDVDWVKETEVFKKGTDEAAQAKNAYNMKNALKDDFEVMFNGKTKFENALGKRNPFDARTLQHSDNFVNSMADEIADADSMRVGEGAMYQKPLKDVETYIKKNKITNDEMMQAIYHLEGKAPKVMGQLNPSEKVIQLANMIKPLLKKMASEEQAGGVLGKTRKNYFPHVINKSDDDMKAIQEFMDKRADPSDLAGKSSKSGHDQSRRSFDTLADRDDYLVKLAKQIDEATDPDDKAALIAQMERIEDLFDTDIVSALTRRIKSGVRAKAMKAMQGELSKYGMMVSNPKNVEKIKGLKKLDAEEVKKLGLGKGQHYMKEEVLEGLKRVDEVFTNQGMNKMVRHLNAFSDIWRSLVTHYKLSHYRNNIIGNVITNMAAGVKVNDYAKAKTLLKGYKDGTLSDEQLKLIESAYKHNVISGGFLTDANRAFKFDKQTKLEDFADKITDNKAISKVRGVGEKADDITRLANYFSGLRNYGDSKRAAQQVRKYLFNYNELTNADRHMRTIVPFWNWIKRNIPLQTELLMENPKFAMNIERFKNLFNDEREGEDWQKETGIKIPGMNYYTSVPSPTHDLNTLLNPGSLLGSINPAAKMLIETKMNKNMYTGKPISYGEDSVKPEDLPQYLAKNFGITGNLYDAGTGKKDPMEALINYLNPITKIQE